MMHLLTKLVNLAISENSSTKIQTLEHIQRRIELVSLDIKDICVGYGFIVAKCICQYYIDRNIE